MFLLLVKRCILCLIRRFVQVVDSWMLVRPPADTSGAMEQTGAEQRTEQVHQHSHHLPRSKPSLSFILQRCIFQIKKLIKDKNCNLGYFSLPKNLWVKPNGALSSDRFWTFSFTFFGATNNPLAVKTWEREKILKMKIYCRLFNNWQCDEIISSVYM